ncbi:PQQ-dependent sugar dehydrogenase [Candidatus Microgenomates bacterium]|nr:PQQ-dependent sugar dehydrogenase [Candidatus Microgenomates bacterium]
MRNIIIAAIIIGLFLGGIWIVRQRVGDVRPALLPPRESITGVSNIPSVGDTPSFPLKLPQGFQIGIFAKNLGNARDLEFTSRGTLLLSIPADGRVVALPDRDGNGVADSVIDVLTNLERPHGLAFYNGKLFVAEETQVVRYKWDEENLTATKDKVLFSLPKGGRHFTRSISFNPSASFGQTQDRRSGQVGQMFVSIGSTCDVCFEKHEWLAGVIVSDEDGTSPRVWAKGLRNSVFITVNPQTGELWGTEMGRDWLGDNLPPDEVNIIKDGKDYGWPVCYGTRVHDTDFDKRAYIQIIPQLPCGTTEPPVYEIPAHSAPLGLTFIPSVREEQASLINSSQFPKEWQGDLLVSYHGSWNRSTPIGYKVVRLDVEGNTVRGEEDFITDFLQGSQTLGRPVDLIFDKEGSLYISDDKAGVVYKVINE